MIGRRRPSRAPAVALGPLVAAVLFVALAPGSMGASARVWPDTASRIGVFADQFGRALSPEQQRFVAAHFAGSQKLTLNQSRPLRALNPNFIVLHYHLAVWQSASETPFITDGSSWANDYPVVTTHENWFWHNPAGERVASRGDGKILMNISDPGFRAYWSASIAAQVRAGDYDGVFFDSASPALLQDAVSAADARLAGTAAKDTAFAELGGKTWIRAWEEWMAELTQQLGASHVPLIPNVDGLVTDWDNTNYGLASGIFVEGFADPAWPVEDWRASTNAILAQARAGRIVILENYLPSPDDVARRRYYLANYLLVKGRRTYVEYFSGTPLQWFPEWSLELGAGRAAAGVAGVEAFAAGGIYRREFANGLVLVNPIDAAVTVPLGKAMRRVEMSGGGDIPEDGKPTGRIYTSRVTSIVVPAKGGEILLR